MCVLRIKDANGVWVALPAIKGDKGDTPIKGVDYFTEADKTEIAEQVATMIDTSLLSAIGTGVLE